MCANPQSNRFNTIAVRASYISLILRRFPWWKPRKTGGGLSPTGKNQNRNKFVFLSFGVDPLNWQSFTEIGEVACSTTSRRSRGHALKSWSNEISLPRSVPHDLHTRIPFSSNWTLWSLLKPSILFTYRVIVASSTSQTYADVPFIGLSESALLMSPADRMSCPSL